MTEKRLTPQQKAIAHEFWRLGFNARGKLDKLGITVKEGHENGNQALRDG